jgi:3-hydroxy-9,10-secoandrosta-1,3,5(10)-triene-9,17-dione monooxygenase reductase component
VNAGARAPLRGTWAPVRERRAGVPRIARVVGPDELREAMRRFPAGIAVLTLHAEGRPLGVTVGSLVSLSLEPPLVGVSIGRSSQLHEPFRDAGRFVVNVLAGDQAHLAQHFARSVPPIALWSGIPTRQTTFAEPLLDGALAWIECRTRAAHDAGDHTFFVADVLSTELGRWGPGLVYVGGEYRSL